jgi:hypothetical protein
LCVNRRPTVTAFADVSAVATPPGGYVAPLETTLPSSPEAATLKLTVVEVVGLAATTAVGAEVAACEPPPFEAVTTTRIVRPTSAALKA